MCGHSADMQNIFNLKKKYNFKIIRLLSCFVNIKIINRSCKFSDLSTFSFHPVKPLTTGEGGITTNNKFEKIKIFRTE